MSQNAIKKDAIKKLYDMDLSKQEVAFVFLEGSGVLVLTQSSSFAFDIAGFLKASEMNQIPKVDFLFYTHIHYDHYNKAKAIMFHKKTNAHIIASEDIVAELVEDIPSENLTVADPGRTFVKIPIEGLNVQAIRGVHAGPFSQYRVKAKGISIFHAGDSGHFRLGPQSAKIAFIPTGDPSPWCSPEVALATAMYVNPQVVVATHGDEEQMKRFKELMCREMPDVDVIIPKQFEPVRVKIR